ncbi:hypothetical protein [Aurantibacillus circumpalustris]|uniref:hypothetical protein n=1 Tax=Aurantibacillus circumpalustris TaxID=3036359 RepID=UPI00295C296C|nr:hypothetical protein [Aurantibacillus circumpalustris]
MIKKIAIKFLMLLLILTGLNFIYNLTLYEKDLNEKSKEVLEIRDSQENTDVYYFGESSNVTFKNDDSLQNSISEMTNFFFPNINITTITKYATHAGIYKHWLRKINVNDRKPSALIVTLNMRSFDGAWIHSKLETQLQESLVLTQPYPNLVNRFLLALQAFDNKTEQQREQQMLKEWKTVPLIFPNDFKYKTVSEWDYGMSQGTYLNPDGSWDDEKIILACHYIKGYAFNLNENNPRIKDFDEIADWCHSNKINLYLNLMAENVQYADSLVGKELVFLMRQNRDYLVKRYTKNNCVVVDNLELVQGKEFIDQKWTTEHYGYKGRMAIAKNLANHLKDQFKNEYKTAY